MSQEKKRRMAEKKIGTHDGAFHCDEVLACSLLKMLPLYQNAEIVRSRNQGKLSECDIVVDVGGVYDASKHRYDHHQRDFHETMSSLANKKWKTKLSSAGLIYFHFGHEILMQEIGEEVGSKETVGIIYDKIYENFIEEIDAIDNGINQYDGDARYKVSTSLSSRVSRLNPKWNDPNPDPWKGFQKAMELVKSEFLERVFYFKDSWLPARSLVEDAVKKRFEIDARGEIVVFQRGGCPWKEHLFDIENEQSISPDIKYVLYQDQVGKWRIQCVPVSLTSFENRLSMVEDWRGLRDDDLIEKSKIPGCIFVHSSGFIGGNETYDGALEMARRSLQQPK